MADLVSDVQITETESDARPSKRTKHSASKTDSGATLAKIGVPPQQTLLDRMHDFMTTNDAANYLGVQLRDGANFKCITNLNGAAPKPGRSAPKVTKFMLQTKAGATEWAMVGRSLFPKCSAQQCSMPSQFQTENSPIDLALCLATTGDAAQMEQCESMWSGYKAQSDIFKENANKILGLATEAVAKLMLDTQYDSLPGIDNQRRKKFQKHGNLQEAQAWIDDNFGARLNTEERTYFTAKQRSYETTVARLQTLMEAGASRTADETVELDTMGREVFKNVRFIDGTDGTDKDITSEMWLDDTLAPSNGDLCAIFFQIVVVCAAGNFHISPQLGSCVILRRSGKTSGASGGFSAALKAIGMNS